jgi:two-component system OmpR family sensor kinase
VEPERDNVDLGRLLGEVVADARFEAETSGRTVALVVGQPATVAGAAALLRSALENVVRNAVAHALGTGVDVCCRHRGAGCGAAVITVATASRRAERSSIASSPSTAFRGQERGPAASARPRHHPAAVEWHGGSVAAANHPDGAASESNPPAVA